MIHDHTITVFVINTLKCKRLPAIGLMTNHKQANPSTMNNQSIIYATQTQNCQHEA